VSVMLVDNDDVATYIDALGLLDSTQLGFQHKLFLGKAITPAGFHRLTSAPGLPSGLLCIQGGVIDSVANYRNATVARRSSRARMGPRV
jgi:hypothetical protein